MAIPKDLYQIATNMGMIELQEVCAALQVTTQPEIHWLGKPMVFCEACSADFMFRGNTYSLNEHYEMVTSIHRK